MPDRAATEPTEGAPNGDDQQREGENTTARSVDWRTMPSSLAHFSSDGSGGHRHDEHDHAAEETVGDDEVENLRAQVVRMLMTAAASCDAGVLV